MAEVITPLFVRMTPASGRRFFLRSCDFVHKRPTRTPLPTAYALPQEGGMVAIQDIVERESIELQVDSKANDFFSIAVFCGIGLLVSLSVLLLDQYIPGDWF
jgi:hypothetical protein